MSKIPLVSGKEAVKALRRLGFEFIRQKGSHVILCRETPDGKIGCVVPMHSEIQQGTLRGVLKQAKVELDAFRNVL